VHACWQSGLDAADAADTKPNAKATAQAVAINAKMSREFFMSSPANWGRCAIDRVIDCGDVWANTVPNRRSGRSLSGKPAPGNG
jgi:hypothetical protein